MAMQSGEIYQARNTRFAGELTASFTVMTPHSRRTCPEGFGQQMLCSMPPFLPVTLNRYGIAATRTRVSFPAPAPPSVGLFPPAADRAPRPAGDFRLPARFYPRSSE